MVMPQFARAAPDSETSDQNAALKHFSHSMRLSLSQYARKLLRYYLGVIFCNFSHATYPCPSRR